MFKKFVSFALASVICLSLNGPALALDDSIVTDSDITVINLSERITPQELQEIASCVTAQITKEDGTVVPVEATITVEDLSVEDSVYSTYSKMSSIEGNSYKITLNAVASEDKIDTDSGAQNGTGYNVAATLQLIWTDVFGVDNIIKEVSGTLTILKGTVDEDSFVEWGDAWEGALRWTSRKVGTKPSFAYYPNETAIAPAAAYTVYIEDALVNLCLSVRSSIFQ